MIIHHFILGGWGTLFSNNPKPVPCRFHGLEITRVAKYQSERVQLCWLQWLYWSCLKFWKSKIPYLEVQLQWTKWMYFTTSWKTVAFSLRKTSGLPLKQPKKLMNMIMEFQNTYTNVKMVPSFKMFQTIFIWYRTLFSSIFSQPICWNAGVGCSKLESLEQEQHQTWSGSPFDGKAMHGDVKQHLLLCLDTKTVWKVYERYMKGIWKVYER